MHTLSNSDTIIVCQCHFSLPELLVITLGLSIILCYGAYYGLFMCGVYGIVCRSIVYAGRWAGGRRHACARLLHKQVSRLDAAEHAARRANRGAYAAYGLWVRSDH